MNNRRPSESTSQTSSGVKHRNQWDSTTYSNGPNDNRSFTKQQNWEINRNNQVVQKRIDAAMTKPRRPVSTFIKPAGKSSAANNQSLKAKEILKANQKMAIRIQNAKSTIGK